MRNATRLIQILLLSLGIMLAGCNGGASSSETDTGGNPDIPGDNSGDNPGDNNPPDDTTPPGDTNPPDDGGEPGDNPDDGSDKQAPSITATNPADNSDLASSTSTITVQFDEPIDPASVSTATVALIGPSGTVPFDVAVTDARMILTPQHELLPGNAYTATVDAHVADLAGNPLGHDYSWKFVIADGLCAGFYLPGFNLLEGKLTTPPLAGLIKPVKGVPYVDPVHGTCVTRVTNHEAEGLPGFARNDYSRRQPFNADDSKVLVYSQDGNWHLYDTHDMSYIRVLHLGGNGVEPQWHPTNPDLLYMFPNNGGMTISTINVVTGEQRVVADFRNVVSIAGHPGATDIRDVWPNAARVWTRSEGSPSADARYWGLQVDTGDFQGLGMITYDLVENRITGTFDFSSNGIGRPNHISMSPSGKYVVPSWHIPDDCASLDALGTRDNPCGLMSYTRDFSSAVGLTVRGPHSDIGIDAEGNDVIVASDYVSGWVEMWDLATGENTRLWQIYVDGNSTSVHVSAKNFNKPGWVLISTYLEKYPGWYAKKIMAVELKENPRILNIAHTYNQVDSYFSETHAAANRDFTKIMFNSNWNTNNVLNIDAYMITLPADAVPAVK